MYVAGIIVIKSSCSSTEELDHKTLRKSTTVHLAKVKSRYSNRMVTLIEYSAAKIV